MFKNIFSLLVMAAITIAAIAGDLVLHGPRFSLEHRHCSNRKTAPPAPCSRSTTRLYNAQTRSDLRRHGRRPPRRQSAHPLYRPRRCRRRRIAFASSALPICRAPARRSPMSPTPPARPTRSPTQAPRWHHRARLPFTVARDNIHLAIAQSIQIINRRVNQRHSACHRDAGRRPHPRQGAQHGRLHAPALAHRPAGTLTFHTVRGQRRRRRRQPHPPGTMLVQPIRQPRLRWKWSGHAARLAGAHIARHAQRRSSTGEIVIIPSRSTTKARIFCNITRQSVGERFAVLIDLPSRHCATHQRSHLRRLRPDQWQLHHAKRQRSRHHPPRQRHAAPLG